jgi:hypothetical protein
VLGNANGCKFYDMLRVWSRLLSFKLVAEGTLGSWLMRGDDSGCSGTISPLGPSPPPGHVMREVIP